MAPRKKPEGYISCPPNCFMLYRSYKNKQLSESQLQEDRKEGGIQSDYSKEISCLWHAEPQEVKECWKTLAKEVARKHREMHPLYAFKPIQRKHKKTAHVLEHQDQGTRTPSAKGHSPMGPSRGLGLPPSPPDLTSSSSSSSSAKTTPGPSTPQSSSDFQPLAGPWCHQQASAQGNPYEPWLEQRQHTISREQHGVHVQQQMLAQDRTYDNHYTAGYTMGPAPRQQSCPAAASRGNPYSRLATPNAHIQQDHGGYQAALPFIGNLQDAFQPYTDDYFGGYLLTGPQHVAHTQAMQRCIAAPGQTHTPQRSRFDTEFTPLDAGFYDFAAMPQVNGSASAHLQLPPVQPQALPLSAPLNAQGYDYPAGSDAWSMQAGLEASFAMPARPHGPAISCPEQWDMAHAPSFGSPGQQFQAANTGDSNGLASYGTPDTAGLSQFNYVPMDPLLSDAAAASTTERPAFNSFDLGFLDSFPSAPSTSIPYGTAEQSSHVQSNTNYVPAIDDQGALDQQSQAPLNMTHSLPNVVDSDTSPSSNVYDPLKTPPADAIWPESLPSGESESADPFHEWWSQLTPDA
ncbi:hypothetical protein TRAPUB_3114 [Trametes pubescens]|uniref:HMG box domain-containing protein n=1 Tax=Trametes pubescens TaxID=154538 RepID=A0A1M2VEM5_TRAPU|nr:hypothetical protein TRAPUB_3114 [Trametes pubescens]